MLFTVATGNYFLEALNKHLKSSLIHCVSVFVCVYKRAYLGDFWNGE